MSHGTIGDAVEWMNAGYAVRRTIWPEGRVWKLGTGPDGRKTLLRMDTRIDRTDGTYDIPLGDALATDWYPVR